MKKAIQWILKKLAQLTVWKYRPGIIGVTGSVGKTSTKYAIAAVLGNERHVRVSVGNFNSEIGLPVNILGEWKPEELKLISRETKPGEKNFQKFLFITKIIFASIFRLVFRAKNYPEILVLEYGADRPDDLKYLLNVARPNMGAITAIGEIPVHVEFFEGPAEVAREKARLIESLASSGFAVLNHDDHSVMDLKDRTRAHVLTFGFGKGSDVRIANFENKIEDNAPVGISFKLEYGGSSIPVRLTGVFGKAQAYAAAAAACFGLVFGINLIKIAEALKSCKPAAGRMQLVPGIKSTLILDDSYNASPLSMHAALDTLRDLPAKRKVAVLGDMLEIGKYAMEAHEGIGEIAGKIVNVLVTVGPRAKFIAESARKNGIAKKNIYSFEIEEDAEKTVLDILRKGDLVLVKGSHAMGLDKIVEELRYRDLGMSNLA